MITRKSFRFVLTAVLTLCSWASLDEEDNHITLSFIIWSPTEMDTDINNVEVDVLNALQNFFCEDIDLIVLDKSFMGVCYQKHGSLVAGAKSIFSTNFASEAMLEFLKNTDPDRSFLINNPTNVIISDSSYVNGTLQRTSWDVNYEVLQIGSVEIEKARMSNFTDVRMYMEDRLHASIRKGEMNQWFSETGIIMGIPGSEWQIFPEISSSEDEDSIINGPEVEYNEPAIILRYIGIVLMIGSFFGAIILTYLGRCYRIKTELKELSPPDPEEQRGLVTEQGVNLMLEIGRRESERLSSNT